MAETFTPRTDWRDEEQGAPYTPVRAADLLRYERALDGIYKGRIRRGTIMAMGDSLAAVVATHDSVNKLDSHSGVQGGHSAGDYLFQANLLLDSPFDVLGSAATSGHTIEQIQAQHLPTVIAARPEYCICFSLGANNALASGDFPRSMLERSLAVLNELDANGITPIVFTFPPVGPGDLTVAEIERYHSFLSYHAQARGWPFLDVYGLLVDPATAKYRPGLTDDNTHPNGQATAIMSAALAPLLEKLDRTGTRAQHVAFNYFEGAPGTAPNTVLVPAGDPNVPNGWYISGGATALAMTDTNHGYRLTWTREAADVVAFGQSIDVAPGDRWDYVVRLGADVPAGGRWGAGLADQTGSAMAANAYNQELPVADVRSLHWRGVVPAGVTKLTQFFALSGAAGTRLRLEQPTLRNLSAKNIPL